MDARSDDVTRPAARVLGGALWVDGPAGDSVFVPVQDLDVVVLGFLVESFPDGERLGVWLATEGLSATGGVAGPLVSFGLDNGVFGATDASGRSISVDIALEDLALRLVERFIAERGFAMEELAEWLGHLGVHVAHVDAAGPAT